MLISHKLLRWVPYLIAPPALVGLGVLAFRSVAAAAALSLLALGSAGGVWAIWYRGNITWKPLAFAGFAVAALNAGFLAWLDALRGERMITWNPTPRTTAPIG
jgi:hypothetical protein